MAHGPDKPPVTMFVAGYNKSLALSLGGRFFPSYSITNKSDVLGALSEGTFGSSSKPGGTMFLDPSFSDFDPIYSVQSRCKQIPQVNVSIPAGSVQVEKEVQCLKGVSLLRNNASEINNELYKGHRNGNPKGENNEFVAANDFPDSSNKNFNLDVWYNSTMEEDSDATPIFIRRIPRAINLATNAYLEFVKEMTNHAYVVPVQDLYATCGALIFTWMVLQLYPMHRLCDGSYWTISYIYFLAISCCYMLCFAASCFFLGPDFFRPHEASLQFVFYFIYLNVQIAYSMVFSGIFSTVRTSSVVAYMMVFGTGLLGKFYFEGKVTNLSFPRGWITALETYPGFALYRMLYEFSKYGNLAELGQATGMTWKDLNNSNNCMKDLFILMPVQWVVLLLAAYYVDHVFPTGCGVRRSPLYFIQRSSSNRLNSTIIELFL